MRVTPSTPAAPGEATYSVSIPNGPVVATFTGPAETSHFIRHAEAYSGIPLQFLLPPTAADRRA